MRRVTYGVKGWRHRIEARANGKFKLSWLSSQSIRNHPQKRVRERVRYVERDEAERFAYTFDLTVPEATP